MDEEDENGLVGLRPRRAPCRFVMNIFFVFVERIPVFHRTGVSLSHQEPCASTHLAMGHPLHRFFWGFIYTADRLG